MTKPNDSELVIIEQDTNDFVTITKAFSVVDQKSVERGVELAQRVKGLTEEINSTFDPHIADAHAAHKSLLATKQKLTEPLLEAEKLIKQKLGDYTNENPKTIAKGLSYRDSVTVVVEDFEKLIKAVARGTTPDSVLKPDLSMLKKISAAGFKLPGCVITKTPVVSIRK